MTVEIRDELNNIDISPEHVVKVVEEKTNAYPQFTTFIVISFVGGETATLKGWTLEQWRTFKRTLGKSFQAHCQITLHD